MVNFSNLNKTQLSTKQQRVMKVVEKRGLRVAYMSIEELAIEANVSTATISRFWKMAGYKSFKQFKEHVKQRIESTPENKLRNFFLDVGSDNLFEKIIEQNHDYLFQTYTHLNREDLNEAVVEMINAARVIVHAPSSSEGLGTLLTYRLKRFGIYVEQIAKSGHEIYESMIHFHKGDVIVIFQFVKLLPESKIILDYAKQLGIQTILITDQLVASMNELADYVLYAHRGDTWEFHSMVAPTAVVEALIMKIGMQLEEQSIENMEKISKLRRDYEDIVPS